MLSFHENWARKHYPDYADEARNLPKILGGEKNHPWLKTKYTNILAFTRVDFHYHMMYEPVPRNKYWSRTNKTPRILGEPNAKLNCKDRYAHMQKKRHTRHKYKNMYRSTVYNNPKLKTPMIIYRITYKQTVLFFQCIII